MIGSFSRAIATCPRVRAGIRLPEGPMARAQLPDDDSADRKGHSKETPSAMRAAAKLAPHFSCLFQDNAHANDTPDGPVPRAPCIAARWLRPRLRILAGRLGFESVESSARRALAVPA